jgi:K+-sensing histidine kinase KdpD
MDKTIAFVTNQYSSDRIILAARHLSDQTRTELVVVEILDSEYELDPKAVDYLFTLSKTNKATMRIMFTDDKLRAMRDIIAQEDTKCILTGMPDSNHSVLYSIWKEFPAKSFYTVDQDARMVPVAKSVCIA